MGPDASGGPTRGAVSEALGPMRRRPASAHPPVDATLMAAVFELQALIPDASTASPRPDQPRPSPCRPAVSGSPLRTDQCLSEHHEGPVATWVGRGDAVGVGRADRARLSAATSRCRPRRLVVIDTRRSPPRWRCLSGRPRVRRGRCPAATSRPAAGAAQRYGAQSRARTSCFPGRPGRAYTALTADPRRSPWTTRVRSTLLRPHQRR